MKIYRIAQKSIKQIATQCRKDMVQKYGDQHLKEKCLPISKELVERLYQEGYHSAMVVQGLFHVDNPDPSIVATMDRNEFNSDEEFEDAKHRELHYWAEINYLVIDITATQFNDEMNKPELPIKIMQFEQTGYKVIQRPYDD